MATPRLAIWRRHATPRRPVSRIQHSGRARPPEPPPPTGAERRGNSDRARRPPGREADPLQRRRTATSWDHPDADHRARRPAFRPLATYSHSIVAGGFDVTSRTTRLTPGISLTRRLEIVSIRS